MASPRDHRSGSGLAAPVERDIVVVEKPVGVMTVPFDPTDKDTLVDRTRTALRRRGSDDDPPFGVVQRLDKNTTSLPVFTRTVAAKKHLQQQCSGPPTRRDSTACGRRPFPS